MKIRNFLLIALLLLPGCKSLYPGPGAMMQDALYPRPEMISRLQWDAKMVSGSFRRHEPVKLTIFQDDSPEALGQRSSLYLKSLQAQQRKENQWNDIGAHYYINGDGFIYRGRDPIFIGKTEYPDFTTEGHLLIYLIGDFDKEFPSRPMFESLSSLLAWLSVEYKITNENIKCAREYGLAGHPGKGMYQFFTSGAMRIRTGELSRKEESKYQPMKEPAY